MTTDSFMTTRQAAKELGIRMAILYQAIWDGFLSGRKDANGRWQVRRDSVTAYRQRRERKRKEKRG